MFSFFMVQNYGGFIPAHQREDAVNSLTYEAEARLKDPVYGCVGAITILQRQVFTLQRELDATNADIMRFASGTGAPRGSGSGYDDPNSTDYWTGKGQDGGI
ncbi:hypothetical protein SASPL_118269 [Salvia splendens]|uniref:LOB domain-containing protein n=1 Tax=Salvia splendens TaxID=180675 RepID=A0A8X8ZX31_SALSN|nr:hypothetical protein SASPL_118269 [Salvia splendens]